VYCTCKWRHKKEIKYLFGKWKEFTLQHKPEGYRGIGWWVKRWLWCRGSLEPSTEHRRSILHLYFSCLSSLRLVGCKNSTSVTGMFASVHYTSWKHQHSFQSTTAHFCTLKLTVFQNEQQNSQVGQFSPISRSSPLRLNLDFPWEVAFLSSYVLQ
jgi:hypothetical protein